MLIKNLQETKVNKRSLKARTTKKGIKYATSRILFIHKNKNDIERLKSFSNFVSRWYFMRRRTKPHIRLFMLKKKKKNHLRLFVYPTYWQFPVFEGFQIIFFINFQLEFTHTHTYTQQKSIIIMMMTKWFFYLIRTWHIVMYVLYT